MQEAEAGYSYDDDAGKGPEPTAGLNGIHLDALLKMMNKLDKLAEGWGTHVIGEATFEIFDGNGEGVNVIVCWSDTLSLHYLARVAS